MIVPPSKEDNDYIFRLSQNNKKSTLKPVFINATYM